MSKILDEQTAKKTYEESNDLVRSLLEEKFGKEFFGLSSSNEFDFKSIKTFEDACKRLNVNPKDVYSPNDAPDEIAYKQLKIIVKAINNGWTPDFKNTDKYKYYPWFNRSSGFSFNDSDYYRSYSCVGSLLLFESEEKCEYAAKQFIDIYEQFFTYTNMIFKSKEFDYRDIKTFKDACNKLGISDVLPDVSNIPFEFRKAHIAHYQLMVIYKAINDGWEADHSNENEYKYYPYFRWNEISGFSFYTSGYGHSISLSFVGSSLSTNSEEKSEYIGEQFIDIYNDFLKK